LDIGSAKSMEGVFMIWYR